MGVCLTLPDWYFSVEFRQDFYIYLCRKGEAFYVSILVKIGRKFFILSSKNHENRSYLSSRPVVFYLESAWQTRTWQRTQGTCILSSVGKFHAAVAEEMPNLCQPIRDQCGHPCWQNSLKNINMCHLFLHLIDLLGSVSRRIFPPCLVPDGPHLPTCRSSSGLSFSFSITKEFPTVFGPGLFPVESSLTVGTAK